MPSRGELQGKGRPQSLERLDSVGGGTTLKEHLEPPASRIAKSKKVEWELPLIGVPQGQHNWWTKGLGRSRRTLRKWTGGWTTVKSVAQEGRKVKPIPLPTPPVSQTGRTLVVLT